jgi:hypothetical protein
MDEGRAAHGERKCGMAGRNYGWRERLVNEGHWVNLRQQCRASEHKEDANEPRVFHEGHLWRLEVRGGAKNISFLGGGVKVKIFAVMSSCLCKKPEGAILVTLNCAGMALKCYYGDRPWD